MPAPPHLYAGTSGWAYPSWKPGFYPEKTSPAKFLPFYATQLSSVEVNYTFRTLPTPKQLATWLAATPPHFRFSFKAPQRITHFARLLDCDTHLAEFLAGIQPIRDAGKLGLLLFQLPPNFKATDDTRARVASFLALPALAEYQIAFEFRHESWFAETTYTLLRDRNAALCIAESDDLASPEVHTAATHACFRLRRNGAYPKRQLAALAKRLAALAHTSNQDPNQARAVYAYFKHEDEPTGALNAVDFLKAASSPRRAR